MGVIAIKAYGDAAVTFEPVKAAFDTVALLAELLFVRDLNQTVGLGRNHGLHVPLGQQGAKGVGVIAPVGDYSFCPLVSQQSRGTLAVRFLTTGKQQTHRPPQGIKQKMALGGQHTTGSPQSLE